MRDLFIDTGALYALADRDDAFHAEAKALVKRIKKDRRGVFTTNYVVAETHALILSRLGHERARQWLKNFNIRVEQAGEEDQRSGKTIILDHGDKKYSLVDAISFAVMERSNADTAFAFDPHFEQYGFSLMKR